MTVEAIEKALSERDENIQAKLKGLQDENEKLKDKYLNVNDRLFDLEQRGVGYMDAGVGRRKYDLAKVLKWLANPRSEPLDGYEREVHQELKEKMPGGSGAEIFVPLSRKVLDAGANSPTAGGGNLIQTTVSPEVIPPLSEYSLYMSLNPRVLQAGRGSLAVPKVNGALSGYVVSGDGENITPSTNQIGTMYLDPMYYSALTTVTKKTLDQGNPDVARMVLEDIIRQIGVLVDLKAFVGSGSGEATGIYTAAGNAVSNSPQSVTYADLVEMERLLIDDKVVRDGWVYVASPAAFQTMKTTTKTSGDTSSNFIAEPDGRGGWMANGYPLHATTHLTGNQVLLYRTRAAVYGDWGAIGIAEDPGGSNFASGSVSFRGMLPFDSNLTHAEAACTLN